MTTADLRSSIIQLVQDEEDTSVLEAIRTLLSRVKYASAEEDDMTDAEVAELEERYQEIMTGKVKPMTHEEFIRKLREGEQDDL